MKVWSVYLAEISSFGTCPGGSGGQGGGGGGKSRIKLTQYS